MLAFIELAIVQLFCCRELEKKQKFFLKLSLLSLLSVAAIVLPSYITTLIPNPGQDYSMLRIYLYDFGIIFLASMMLYKAKRQYIVFSIIVGSLTVFLSEGFGNLIIMAVRSAIDNFIYGYELLILSLTYILVFYLSHHFLIVRYRSNISDRSFPSLAIFTSIFIAITFGMKQVEIYIRSLNNSYLMMILIIEILYAFIMFCLLYGLLNQRESEAEMALIKQSWNDDRKHYEMQKEAVEMINIRVHDLKHQIQDMKNQGELTDKMIRQLEDSADIYQSVVQTGNDVLDVILSSVSLRCQKNKTQLTVMADGLAVSFMDDTDIYSLFGNMMDNAIEYENSIEEENLRFISLTIKKKEDIVYIHSENYFGKEMPKDDFLMTTKNDFSNHGYGTKSMKKIVEKYKGVIHFYVADQMFQVDCMIDTTKEVSS